MWCVGTWLLKRSKGKMNLTCELKCRKKEAQIVGNEEDISLGEA